MNKECVIDVSCSHDGMYAFCPYDKATGDVIVGMTLITSLNGFKGKIVGLFHPDGQEAVEEWIKAHPDEKAEIAKRSE